MLINNLIAAAAPSNKGMVAPSPYPSPGLMQAVWDSLGGSWVENSIRGDLDSATFTTTAGTTTADTTVTSPTFDSDGSWSGETLRQRIDTTIIGNTGTVSITSITLTAGSSSGMTINAAYFGIAASSGSAYSFATSPTQLTFGGLASVTVAAGQSVTSDPLTLSVAAGQSVVLSAYFPSGTNQTARYTGTNTGYQGYYISGDDSSTVTATGYTTGSKLYAVANFVVHDTAHPVTQVIIPSDKFGGAVTWVRGVWKTGVQFRWSGYMAGLSATQPVQADTTNYLSTVINQATQTVINCASPLPVGTVVQVYYSYRTGQKTIAGNAADGWPVFSTAELADDYGTANDGDCYIMSSLYYAYQVTGIQLYKLLADRIINAQLAWGSPQGQTLYFDYDFNAEEFGAGIYNYFGNNATLTWSTTTKPAGVGNCLHVQTTKPGAPDYGYSGWGWWPSWPVSALTPVSSVTFDVYGDGSGNQIELNTNIDPNKASSGDLTFSFPLFAKDANTWRTFTVQAKDFWKISNVVYNGDRAPFGGSRWVTAYGDDANAATYALTDYAEDAADPQGCWQFYTKQLTWNIPSAAWGVGFIFGMGGADSSGSTNLKMELFVNSTATPNLNIKVTDASSVTHIYTMPVTQGWQSISIPWTTFNTGGSPLTAVTHPITQIAIENHNVSSGSLRVNSIRFDDVVSMATLSPTVMNGLQFNFSTYGTTNVYFDNVQIHQATIDPYPMLPRWTYSWKKFSNTVFGKGTWRGAQAPGYLWMTGFYLSGITYPAGTIATYPDGSTIDYSGRLVSDCIVQFMKDSQDAYAAQFPTQLKGPFMKKYGAWAWEHTGGSGYIAGSAVPNGTYPNGVLNQWFVEGNDDWYGYQYRALATLAHYYYLSGDAKAKGILDNWMTWVDTKIVAGTSSTWACPSTFNIDGTVSASYAPIYAHALVAEACIFKYWRDGDTIAHTWYRRLLDDLHTNYKYTSTGSIRGIHVTNGGSGYTSAPTVVFTGGGGSSAAAKAIIAGGAVSHIEMTNVGSGYTSTPEISFTGGGGTGAIANAFSDVDLYGAYDKECTGWETSEVGNVLGMLINGRPGGVVNYPLTATSQDIQDYQDLNAFIARSTRDVRPSLFTSKGLPMHEYTQSSWHWNTGIENPIERDTHVDGMSWTEDLGPWLTYAVDWYRYSGDHKMLSKLVTLVYEMSAYGKR